MEEISRQYNQLLDEGISITELYVYHLIISDDRSYRMNEQEIADMIRDVIDKRYATGEDIETIVNKLLDGDEFDGDEEEWY